MTPGDKASFSAELAGLGAQMQAVEGMLGGAASMAGMPSGQGAQGAILQLVAAVRLQYQMTAKLLRLVGKVIEKA